MFRAARLSFSGNIGHASDPASLRALRDGDPVLDPTFELSTPTNYPSATPETGVVLRGMKGADAFPLPPAWANTQDLQSDRLRGLIKDAPAGKRPKPGKKKRR
jgi:hypothetical protein